MSGGMAEEVFARLFGEDEVADQGDRCCSVTVENTVLADEVPGLIHVKGWLSPAQRGSLHDAISAWGSFGQHGSANQAMLFGNVPQWPAWAQLLLHNLGQAPLADLLPQQIAGRQPLFNQSIINYYHPGQGIKPHVDLARFQDCVASVSFGGDALMRFTLDTDPNGHAEHCVLLRAGDLLIMHGPARYAWKHSIDPVEAARLSVTLRRMSDTIVLPNDYGSYVRCYI